MAGTALFASYGAALLSLQKILVQVLGGVTILLGLLFTGVLDRLPLAGRMLRPSFRPRAGLAGAPLLGALFGLGWTPRIGPALAAVLTLAVTAGSAPAAPSWRSCTGLGIGIPFLLIALAFDRGMRAFSFARRRAAPTGTISAATPAPNIPVAAAIPVRRENPVAKQAGSITDTQHGASSATTPPGNDVSTAVPNKTWCMSLPSADARQRTPKDLSRLVAY